MPNDESKTSLVLIHGSQTFILRYQPTKEGLDRALSAIRDWYDNPGTGFDDDDAKVALVTLAHRHPKQPHVGH